MRTPQFQWTTGSPTDARAWSAVCCAVISTLLAIFYFTARAGFANPARPVVVILGLAFWLLVTPFVLHLILRRSEHDGSWASSESFLTLAGVAFTAVTGLLVPRIGFSPFPLFALVGYGAAAWIVFHQFSRGKVRPTLAFLLATLVLTLWIAGVEWANGFLNPLLVENLILYGGSSHVDTWYLGSLANMIQLHGFPSVGLDGTPPLPYHFGSNWLFAQLSSLTRVSIVDFYQLGVPVVVIPLFFRAITSCANDFRVTRSAEITATLYNSPILWVLIAMATVGALPPVALHSAGVWASGPILSESYTLVIPLCLFFMGTLVTFSRNANSPASSALFYLVFIPIGLGAIGVVKISQMILLIVVGSWLVLRYSLWKRPLPAASVLISLVAAWIVYHRVMAPGRAVGIEPFAFLHLLPGAWWVFFPALHLFWTWVYTWLRFREEGIQTFADFSSAFRTRRMIDVEVVLVFAIAGVLPGLIVNIENGNAYYFSDFQRWVSLALLLGSASILATLRGWRGSLVNAKSVQKPFARRLLLVLVAPFVITIVVTSLGWGVRFVQESLNTRREVQQAVGTRPATGVLHGLIQSVRTSAHGHPVTAWREFRDAQISPLSDKGSIERAMRASPRYPIVSALQVISAFSDSTRSESILFIQPDVTIFWRILSHVPCAYSPLVAPAIAGVPLLEGIPPHCDFPAFVLGGGYPQTDHWPTPSDAPDARVCEHALNKGFRRVIRIAPAANNQVSVRLISCTTTPGLKA